MTNQKFTAVNEEAVKAGTEALAQGYDKVIEMTKEQVEKFAPDAIKGFGEFTDFGKANLDATIKAGAIAAKGFEAIGKQFSDYNTKALEAGVANAKALFGVKSVQEAIELQSSFARTSFDNFVAEGTKMSELTAKVAQDASEPLNVQANKAAEKFAKQAAA